MSKGSINKVMLIGNLGADPESRFTDGGTAVCNIRIATSKSWTDKNSGDKQERTQWHRIVMWRQLAEIAGQYLKKGAKVYIEGELETREWEKDGVKQYTTEVVASEMQMLDSRGDRDAQPASQSGYSSTPTSAAPSNPSNGGDEDDLPF